MYKYYIFDLDGTLTYTLEDLHLATNYALEAMNFPTRSIEEVRQFVGNGIKRLVTLAVPEGTTEEDLERCFEIFKTYYVAHCQDHTRLYPGVEEMLRELKRRGARMAIVSNKLQAGVDELYARFFSDTIEVAIGDREGVPRKPAPDMVEHALEALGARRKETVYVGDSEVDIATARNAQLPCLSVLWGFRDEAFLVEHGAERLIREPGEIVESGE